MWSPGGGEGERELVLFKLTVLWGISDRHKHLGPTMDGVKGPVWGSDQHSEEERGLLSGERTGRKSMKAEMVFSLQGRDLARGHWREGHYRVGRGNSIKRLRGRRANPYLFLSFN